jgi:hypothetical protein
VIGPLRSATACGTIAFGSSQCLEALREAKGPMRARSVAEYAMLAKGPPTDDSRVREGIVDQVRIALARLERRGLVRRVVAAPEVWWELVG